MRKLNENNNLKNTKSKKLIAALMVGMMLMSTSQAFAGENTQGVNTYDAAYETFRTAAVDGSSEESGSTDISGESTTNERGGVKAQKRQKPQKLQRQIPMTLQAYPEQQMKLRGQQVQAQTTLWTR